MRSTSRRRTTSRRARVRARARPRPRRASPRGPSASRREEADAAREPRATTGSARPSRARARLLQEDRLVDLRLHERVQRQVRRRLARAREPAARSASTRAAPISIRAGGGPSRSAPMTRLAAKSSARHQEVKRGRSQQAAHPAAQRPAVFSFVVS
jgi:hypothetical protein